ncbi:MAG: protein kinase domain-containing protein [Planctomycetota bacterium]
MKPLDNLWPPLETLKQLASSCDEVESRLKAGRDPDLDAIIGNFPAPFRAAARQELRAVVAEWRGESSSLAAAGTETRANSPTERFQILDKLGEGGMGRVTIAWDRELERRVALKEIRLSEADDEHYQRRFQQESQITARLEHPGIIPIYARGLFAEERPYYAMRLIAGGNSSTMQQAIDELHQHSHNLVDFKRNKRELVRRLIHVCNTVAYAHSQGICHRDLKPENILFGPFGETIVVDWGLAYEFQHVRSPSSSAERQLTETNLTDNHSGTTDRSDANRDQRSFAGTRGYVAPECQLQQPITNWPALDVYSLGAVLYGIITGRSPWESPAPRQLNPRISRSIEAICLKAMNSSVSERYASPLQLATDLENYLVGEPISVLREPWWERTFRWMGRHRRFMTASGLLLCGFSSIAITCAVLEMEHNRDLTKRNLELLTARNQEIEQRQAAENAKRLADEKSVIAQRHEQRAISAIQSFAETVSNDQVMKLSPELQGLRRELLQKPIRIYEQLDAELSLASENSLDHQEQLAVVAARLTQLSTIANELSAATQWNDKSLERYYQLLSLIDQQPIRDSFTADSKREKKARARLGLADSYRQKSLLISQGNQPLEATDYLNQARLQYDQVEDDSRWRLLKLRGRSTVLATLAMNQAQLHDLAAVAQTFDQAIQDRQAIVDLLSSDHSAISEDPDRQLQQARDDLADLKQDQANIYLLKRLGDRSASFQQFEHYIAELRDRLKAGRGDENVCLKLSWALANHGIHLRSDGELSRAIESLEDAVALRSDLMNRFPSVLLYQVNAGQTLLDLALTLRSSGQLQRSLRRYEQAIGMLRQVDRLQPNGAGNRVTFAFALHDLGHLHLDLFNDEAASAAFEESFSLVRDTDLWQTTNPDVIRLLVDLLDHETFRWMNLGEWSSAQNTYQQLWRFVTRSQSVAPTLITPEHREFLWRRWLLCCQRAGDLQTFAELLRLGAELERADGNRETQRRTWDELLSHERDWLGYAELPSGLLHELAARASQKGEFERAVALLQLVSERADEESPSTAPPSTGPRTANSVAAPPRWQTLILAATAVLQVPGDKTAQLAKRQQALAWMQQSVTVVERQLREARSAGNVNEANQITRQVWEQTLRNPVFVPTLRLQSLELLSAEERQAWEDVWTRIRKLAPAALPN